MEPHIEFKDAGFIVLPSLILHYKDENNYICYSVLEPNLGKYTLSKSYTVKSCDQEQVYYAISLNNIMYLTTVRNIDSHFVGKIYNNKSDEVITYPAGVRHLASFINWPWYEGDQKTYVMQKNLQFSDYNAKISYNPKIIYPDKARECQFFSLIEIDEISYLNQSFEKQLYLKSNNVGWISIISNYSFGIPGKYVYYKEVRQDSNPWKVYNLLTELHFDCNFTSNKFREICKGFVYMSNDAEINGIYLLNENLNINSNLSIDDIGIRLIKINFPKDEYHSVKRIIENPFKTAERDRLANWLYELLEKILPLVITGLITEYCTLVKYYDYDVLMEYINENRHAS